VVFHLEILFIYGKFSLPKSDKRRFGESYLNPYRIRPQAISCHLKFNQVAGMIWLSQLFENLKSTDLGEVSAFDLYDHRLSGRLVSIPFPMSVFFN
jgi:hypothetical protein